MTGPGTNKHQAGARLPRLLEPWSHLTIDGLSRVSARRRGDAPAIIEAPDMMQWYHRGPLSLDQAGLRKRAEVFGLKMLALGLRAGDRVIVQLPNTADLPVALLGLMGVGMVACPVPVIFGFHELLRATELSGARAMVTVGHYGTLGLAELARRVAAAVFTIRFVCGFGAPLPDGVVALDTWSEADLQADPAPTTCDAADVALVTFERHGPDLVALARTHQQLICDALAFSTVARITATSTMLSTLPPVTALGVVAALVAPALNGAVLQLHGPFNSEVLADQLSGVSGAHVLVPAAIERSLPALKSMVPEGSFTPILAHRWPMPSHDFRLVPKAELPLVDLHGIGESALLTATRETDEALKPIPVRVSHPTPHTLPMTIPMLECLLDRESQLTVRGFSVAEKLGSGREHGAEWYETGLFGAVAGPSSISINAGGGDPDSAAHEAA